MKEIKRKFLVFVYRVFDILDLVFCDNFAKPASVKWRIRLGQLHKDLEPKRCPICARQDFENNEKDSVGGQVLEFEVRCKHCDSQVGYWAHGYYQP